ncbi:hypothetical protein PspLS_11574 [Pyricularia sp. CBS 133598]|nr:hypothetical protein PspLS_11574 [Pyricularia sp. CBS 133598]
MSSDLEYRLSEAVILVQAGVLKAQAAKIWSVSRTTLKRRVEGGTTRQQAHEQYQILSPEQELFLCGWIENEEQAGRAPTHQFVREFASLMLPAKRRTHVFGRRWLRAFLRRHPTIRTRVGRLLEGARAEEATGISDRNVIAGFRKAGIWPPFSNKTATPERVVDTDRPPVFPPVGFSTFDTVGNTIVFNTPKTSQDIRVGAQQIQEHFGEVQRDLSLLFRKIDKGMDLQITQVASLQAENARLAEEIKKYKPVPRKAVRKSQQDRFANIEDIYRAQNEVERRRPALEATVLREHQIQDYNVDFPASFSAQDHQEQQHNQ